MRLKVNMLKVANLTMVFSMSLAACLVCYSYADDSRPGGGAIGDQGPGLVPSKTGVATKRAGTEYRAPPDNDDCPEAIDVGVLPATVTVDNTDATDDIEQPCGVYSGPYQNVWYTVTGTGKVMTATTCNVDTEVEDTKISVFCGECAYLICVAGNDDECATPNDRLSTVSWCAEAGTTYYVTVGTYMSHTDPGLIQLEVHDGDTPCTPEVDCTVPTGACCLGEACQLLTQGTCANADGFYLGDGTLCDPNPCLLGACCYWPSGDCDDLSGADCGSTGGNFQSHGSRCAAVICPSSGEDCSSPLLVSLEREELPYTNRNLTCDRGNDYANTCLGDYDGGQEMIYRLTVTEAMGVEFILDPKGTGWTGLAVDDSCPPDDTCLGRSTSGETGSPHSTGCVFLTPGTYYVMVDTWPPPDCLPEFALTILAGCICGDVDHSGGLVDLIDFATFAVCFGQSGPVPGCDAAAFQCSDLNGDLLVDLIDFSTLALWFGLESTQTVPDCTPE